VCYFAENYPESLSVCTAREVKSNIDRRALPLHMAVERFHLFCVKPLVCHGSKADQRIFDFVKQRVLEEQEDRKKRLERQLVQRLPAVWKVMQRVLEGVAVSELEMREAERMFALQDQPADTKPPTTSAAAATTPNTESTSNGVMSDASDGSKKKSKKKSRSKSQKVKTTELAVAEEKQPVVPVESGSAGTAVVDVVAELPPVEPVDDYLIQQQRILEQYEQSKRSSGVPSPEPDTRLKSSKASEVKTVEVKETNPRLPVTSKTVKQVQSNETKNVAPLQPDSLEPAADDKIDSIDSSAKGTKRRRRVRTRRKRESNQVNESESPSSLEDCANMQPTVCSTPSQSAKAILSTFAKDDDEMVFGAMLEQMRLMDTASPPPAVGVPSYGVYNTLSNSNTPPIALGLSPFVSGRDTNMSSLPAHRQLPLSSLAPGSEMRSDRTLLSSGLTTFLDTYSSTMVPSTRPGSLTAASATSQTDSRMSIGRTVGAQTLNAQQRETGLPNASVPYTKSPFGPHVIDQSTSSMRSYSVPTPSTFVDPSADYSYATDIRGCWSNAGSWTMDRQVHGSNEKSFLAAHPPIGPNSSMAYPSRSSSGVAQTPTLTSRPPSMSSASMTVPASAPGIPMTSPGMQGLSSMYNKSSMMTTGPSLDVFGKSRLGGYANPTTPFGIQSPFS
jgi:hypothetical protein